VAIIETLFVSFIGVFSGGLVSLPILYHYQLDIYKITGKNRRGFPVVRVQSHHAVFIEARDF
jgi:hypothetical protein